MPGLDQPALYDIPAACRFLGVSRSTLYTLLRDGRLQARKVGRRTLIPFESLQALLQSLPAAEFRAPLGLTPPPATKRRSRR